MPSAGLGSWEIDGTRPWERSAPEPGPLRSLTPRPGQLPSVSHPQPLLSLPSRSLEDATTPLAARLESRLAVLRSLREPRSVCYPGKLCGGTGADWMWAETEAKEWDPCQEPPVHCCLCHLCSQGTSVERDAGVSRKQDNSAHLLSLYPELTQSGVAWQDVFTTKPEWPTSCRTNCRVWKMFCDLKKLKLVGEKHSRPLT